MSSYTTTLTSQPRDSNLDELLITISETLQNKYSNRFHYISPFHNFIKCLEYSIL
jgi:hypothetical protein